MSIKMRVTISARSTNDISAVRLLRARQRVADCPKDNKAHDQPPAHDDEEQSEHDREKDPIALPRAPWREAVALEQRVIAFVGFEPEGKCVADAGDYADEFVDQNVRGQTCEQNFGQTCARGINQPECGNNRRGGVAEAGQQANNRVEAKAEICARHAKEIIHDEREPFEQRLQPGTALLLLWWKNLPLHFFGFHRPFVAVTINVRPKRRLREFIARTMSMLLSSSVP